MTSPDDVAFAVPGLAGEENTSAIEEDQLNLPERYVKTASMEVGEIPRSVQRFRKFAAGFCNEFIDCSTKLVPRKCLQPPSAYNY